MIDVPTATSLSIRTVKIAETDAVTLPTKSSPAWNLLSPVTTAPIAKPIGPNTRRKPPAAPARPPTFLAPLAAAAALSLSAPVPTWMDFAASTFFFAA